MYIACGVALAWFDSPTLGAVIAMVMNINMTSASFEGQKFQFLDRNYINPAIAASVFITAITDWFGFFVFLGLATLVLLPNFDYLYFT